MSTEAPHPHTVRAASPLLGQEPADALRGSDTQELSDLEEDRRLQRQLFDGELGGEG